MGIPRIEDPPPLRIALMGFGRIGRNLFRILHRRDDLRIAAISDTADHEALEYLLRFDTLFGRFPDELSITDGWLYAGGRRTRMLSAAAPGDADWAELGVHTVVEATSAPRPRAELPPRWARGPRRVILCSPPVDPPDLTVVVGVNDDRLRTEHRIVSNASCTAHCAAPVLELLAEAFGVRRAFLTTTHAYSNQNRLADVPAEDPRRGRAAAENIIPQETAAAAVISELLPGLAGRLTAGSFSVPVPNGSVVDLVCWHEQPVTREAINELMRTAAGSERWRGILDYEDEPIVSSDIIRSPFSSTFDARATMVLGERTSKTLAWYDNGWGYAHRVVDLIERFRDLDEPERQGRAA